MLRKYWVTVSFVLYTGLFLLVTGNVCRGQNDSEGKTLPSIMALDIEDKDGNTFTTGAFLAVEEGMAVTTWYDIKNAEKVTARFPNGEEFEPAGVVDRDIKRNLALMKLKAFGRPLLGLDMNEPVPGTKVYFRDIQSGAFSFSETAVDSIRILNGVKVYYLASLISKENTGGPLLNEQGKALGVLAQILGGDGKNASIALPSAYAFGLDPSLEVKPWGASEDGSVSTPPANTDEIDLQIVEALVQLHDQNAILYWWDENTNGTGYQLGVSSVVYSHTENVKKVLGELSSLQPGDELRGRIIKEEMRALKDCLQGTELFINAIVTAQGEINWGARSQDLHKRSKAVLKNFPGSYEDLLADLKQLMQESTVFKDSMVLPIQYYVGIAEKPSDFKLGADNYIRDQFYILITDSDGLLDNNGFKSMDRILSLNGHEFTSEENIEDFKMMLKSYPEQKVEVVVERGDELKTLKFKVPKTLR